MLKTVARLFAALAVSASAPALALDLNIIAPIQRDFRVVSEDLIATVDYKALGPAEAGGVSGFSAGALGSYVPVNDKAAWKRLTGEDVDELGLIGLSISKGFPFHIDVGAFYSTLPQTDVNVFGGELRYALSPGSTLMPALALRGSYVRVIGIRDFDLESTSVDVSVSKGFAIFTPYAGIGGVYGESDPHGTPGLQKENIRAFKLYAGMRIGFTLMEVTPEYSLIGGTSAFSLKAGVGF